MHALLVKANKDLWDFLSRRLTCRSYALTVGADGQAGGDRIRTDLPKNMVPDMNLPVPDGWSGSYRAARLERCCPAFKPWWERFCLA